MATDTEIVFGLHAVQAALTQHPESVLVLWLDRARQDHRLQQVLDSARIAGVAVNRVTARELDRLTAAARHQGVVVRMRVAKRLGEHDLAALLTGLDSPPLLLVLDGVTDPHNLGACLRSADGAGAHAVIAPRDRACGLTSVVRKVASGAAETLPFIQVTNLARTLRSLQARGIWVVGAAGESAQTPYELDLSGPLALVLGAEGRGLRRLTREACDAVAGLPMHGQIDSLNVSVSAGIFLYEALRQRQGRE